jgi:hypothetical protein
MLESLTPEDAEKLANHFESSNEQLTPDSSLTQDTSLTPDMSTLHTPDVSAEPYRFAVAPTYSNDSTVGDLFDQGSILQNSISAKS